MTGKLTDRKPQGLLTDMASNGLMTCLKYRGTLVCGALVSEPRYYGYDEQYYGFYEMTGYVK